MSKKKNPTAKNAEQVRESVAAGSASKHKTVAPKDQDDQERPSMAVISPSKRKTIVPKSHAETPKERDSSASLPPSKAPSIITSKPILPTLALSPSKLPQTRKCRPTFCSIFYQQKEFMNIESFYALRKLEWQAYREHEAAIKIQTAFRKWLMRENFRLASAAATRIQAGVRGFIARERVEKMKEEERLKKERQKKERAARAIQSAWRGHNSRSRNFSYGKYKDIQRKNSELSRSIDSINSLESLLTSYSTSYDEDGSGDATFSTSKVVSIIESLLSSETTVEDILRLSPSRVDSILAQIESMNEECLKKGMRPRGMNVELIAKIRGEREKKEREEALERMFPRMPSIEGLIRPKEEQVQRLRKALAQFKCTLEADSEEALAKKHHLLRTYQRPGVLSDVRTHRLTPAEQKLKDLKFWEMPRTLYRTSSRSRSKTGSDFLSRSQDRVSPPYPPYKQLPPPTYSDA